MARTRPVLKTSFDASPRLPAWMAGLRGKPLEESAFYAGAALSTLHFTLQRDSTPGALLRARLALSAAEACVVMSGRPERAAELRDAVHLLRPGDDPGPAGIVFQHWIKAVTHPAMLTHLRRLLPATMADRLPVWLDGAAGGPITQAAHILETVLTEYPREDVIALILADAALSRAMGVKYIVPVLASGLSLRDLSRTGEDMRAACHVAVVASVGRAVPMAADLAQKAYRLRAIAPKLRSKQAGDAVEMFLTRDAVSPTLSLRGLLSDRSARRFCDRLVDLGAARELTGRDTFRLYGL